jgi:uncharacterized membrane protein
MWIGAGVGGVLVLSLLLGVAVARILGLIGGEIADVLEAEWWTSAPLTRQTEALAAAPEISAGAAVHDRRSDSSRS